MRTKDEREREYIDSRMNCDGLNKASRGSEARAYAVSVW